MSTAAPRGRPAEVELLAALAAAELSSFLRLAAAAPSGPTLADVRSMSALAAAHLARHQGVAAHLERSAVDLDAATAPWRALLEAFHARIVPSTWGEVLVGARVGDAVATDVLLELAAGASQPTADVVAQEVAPAPGLDDPAAAFVAASLERASVADPLLAARLSLWGRRLVGEALGQAQAALTAEPSLVDLLGGPDGEGGGPGAGQARVVELFARVTQASGRRMTDLGLTP